MNAMIRRLVQKAVSAGLVLPLIGIWPKGARLLAGIFDSKGRLDELIASCEPPHWRDGVDPTLEQDWRMLIDKGRP